jgi:hypothetical protein
LVLRVVTRSAGRPPGSLLLVASRQSWLRPTDGALDYSAGSMRSSTPGF